MNGLFSDNIDLGAVSIGEAFEDGSLSFTDGESPSASIKFFIRGVNDAYPAYIAMINYLKANFWYGDYIAYQGIPLDTIQLSRLGCAFAFSATCNFAVPSNNTNNNGGNNQNRGTTPSSPIINEPDFQLPQIEQNDFQYSTVGGSAHLTHGYATASYVAKETASTYYPVQPNGNGIGWNGEGFDGCDVTTSSETFSVSVSAPNTWISPTYRALITSMTGCVNLLPWFGYEPSCVLFKGLTANPVTLNYTSPDGESIQDWYWRLRFEFEARRAITIPAPVFMSSGSNVGKWKIDNLENDPLLVQQKDALSYATGGTISGITSSSDFAALKTTLQSYCSAQGFKKTLTNSLVDSLDWIQAYYLVGNVQDALYKPGFYYIWYVTEKGYTTAGNAVFPVTKQANLVQVYKTVDFNLLNLPDQGW